MSAKYICLRCLKKEKVQVSEVEKIIIECSYCNGVENWCHTVASKRKKVVKLTQEQADDIAKIPKSKRISSEEPSEPIVEEAIKIIDGANEKLQELIKEEEAPSGTAEDITKAAPVTEDTVDPEAQAEAVEAQSVTAEETKYSDYLHSSGDTKEGLEAEQKEVAESNEVVLEPAPGVTIEIEGKGETIESLKSKIAKLEGKE